MLPSSSIEKYCVLPLVYCTGFPLFHFIQVHSYMVSKQIANAPLPRRTTLPTGARNVTRKDVTQASSTPQLVQNYHDLQFLPENVCVH
jgi:hypothetical protein